MDTSRNARRILGIAALAAVLLVAGSPAVAATSVVRVAPYYWSSADTLCIDSSSESCQVDAHANAATGRIETSARRSANAFTYQGGLAQGHGVVSDRFSPSPRQRSVRAIVNFRLNSATAELFSDDGRDLARVTANAILEIACSGCPNGGWSYTYATLRLADTDPATPANTAASNMDIAMSVETTLETGQKFNGGAFLHLSVTSQGVLHSPLVISTMDRYASAAADVSVTKIEFLSS